MKASSKRLIDNKIFWTAVSVIVGLASWQIISMAVGTEMLLASPVSVAVRFFTLWAEDDFFSTVFYSLLRVFAGFGIAFAAGVFFAIIAGKFMIVDYILNPYITAVKAVPVASFIIFCLIWMNFNMLTVLISFLIAFPVIYSNVLHGISSIDGKMTEMADVFDLPWHKRLFYIWIPGIRPFLISGCRIAAGMAWKSGVAAEVIGMVDGSIGEKLYRAKIYFENADLLAWTLIIILLSMITEKIIVFVLDTVYKGAVKL